MCKDIKLNPALEPLAATALEHHRIWAMGTVAEAVIHDLLSPLNGVMNYAQLVKDFVEPEHPASEFITEIVDGADRLSNMLAETQFFARGDEEGWATAAPAELLQAALALTRTLLRHEGVQIETETAPETPNIRCRRILAQQLLVAILLYVRSDLKKQQTDNAETNRARGAQMLRIQTMPLPAENAGQILFSWPAADGWQADEAAAENALQICRQITALHSGRLSIENTEGRAQIKIMLPADAG